MMSKFRKTKKTTIKICGKTPICPIFAGVKDVFHNMTWNVKNNPNLPDALKQAIKDWETFNNEHKRGQMFFSITKEHTAKSSIVKHADRIGWIVSIGLLRLAGTTLLPLTLQDRYANTHRGDRRKKETKSMDWVKPDFKGMREWFKLLDAIWFVKESSCDIVETSGSKSGFGKATSQTRYGFRARKDKSHSVLGSLFISKRYEATSWYNTCRKCYYDDHSDEVWVSTSTNYPLLRMEGVSYDTILSEIAMSLD